MTDCLAGLLRPCLLTGSPVAALALAALLAAAVAAVRAWLPYSLEP